MLENKKLILLMFLLINCICLPAWAKDVNQAEYVGAQQCASCHAEQYQKWLGSDHGLAMQVATEKTVLGKFDQTRFIQNGIETVFFRDQEHFKVRTQGADGKATEYDVSYTFGFYPLQQYLLEFPDGRLQVIDIAWDSRKKADGGQRWMHLHPEEIIPPGDVLHWTGPNLNWNYMCADCHSTHLQKNYNASTGQYQTLWSEVNVACEACHGPASKHIDWALQPAPEDNKSKGLTVILDDRKASFWHVNTKTGTPERNIKNTNHREIETCARCHSRRSQIQSYEPGSEFMDSYIPALLTEGLYHVDGQMQDEVFVYGSFLQSKMYQHGVTCSDCHDPHSNQLKLPGEQVCYQCHMPNHYASDKHHFHPQSLNQPSCIDCHMPATTYMQVDVRNDHSFRIPRPDLSVTLGVPDVCHQCHQQKSALWASNKLQQWYGRQPQGFQRFADALGAIRSQQPRAVPNLLNLASAPEQPVLVKATALQYLDQYPDTRILPLLKQQLSRTEPLLRYTALLALTGYDENIRKQLAWPFLTDPVRAVRVAAVQALATIDVSLMKKDQQLIFKTALAEYKQTLLFNAERPEAQVNLGNLYVAQRDPQQALKAYALARHLQKQFVPAYVNAAQLLSQLKQEKQVEQLLREGMEYVPKQADLAHALGLSLIRQQQTESALPWLEKAMNWDQSNIRYAYVYAVALNSEGQSGKAISTLETVMLKHHDNADILYALVTFNRDAGQLAQALKYLDRLIVLVPENQSLQQLRKELNKQ